MHEGSIHRWVVRRPCGRCREVSETDMDIIAQVVLSMKDRISCPTVWSHYSACSRFFGFVISLQYFDRVGQTESHTGKWQSRPLCFLNSGNYLENSRSGKSYLFFCPEAECKISQHSCFWSKLLEMQRLLADPRMSESYLDLFQGCVQFGTDIYCEVFVRESMEIYTSVLQSLDSVEISHYHKEQPRPTTAIADNKYFL